MRRIKDQGLRIPEDIAAVGFDDISLAIHFDPSLSTVKQPQEKMDRKGDKSSIRENVVFETELIIRKSSEAKVEKLISALGDFQVN